MKANRRPPSQEDLKAAEMLESRILPAVIETQRKEQTAGHCEENNAIEELLRAAIGFLRGENPHLSVLIRDTLEDSSERWQGAEFVLMLMETLHDNVGGYHPAITAKEVLEWLKSFLIALLLHKDLPQEID